jgi:hypothetical protein
MIGAGRLSSFGTSTECHGWTKSSASDVYLPIDTRERSPAVNALSLFVFGKPTQPSFLLTANSGGQNQYLNNDKDGLEKYRLHNKKEGIMDAATG